MSKFKAGDLAMIVSSLSPENVGRVVELVRRVSGESIVLTDGSTAKVSASICWEITGESLIATSAFYPEGIPVRYAVIEERKLMPLRGDFQPEEERETELSQ